MPQNSSGTRREVPGNLPHFPPCCMAMRGIPPPTARSSPKDSTPQKEGDAMVAMPRLLEQGRRNSILKTNSTLNGGQQRGSGDDNIKVCVRIRPPNEREERHCATPAWSWKDNTIVQTSSGQKNRPATGSYTYDHLFDPMSDTEEIYDSAVRKVILATMGGFHGSVFAYGQTSTGKTHTMQGTEEQPGVIPLAIEECFSYISSCEDDREFLFRVSYLEIYNEQVNDLLCPASTLANVRILESKKLGVQLQGVKEEVVISPQQVYALISAGEAQRHVGSTDANKNSSRSHTIFRMVIESRSRSGRGRSVMSTLSLVDLAGSESVRLANTQGQRQIEGGFINKSLLTLGKVVSMLTEEGDKDRYIPYRDSKLTRLLQPSLGGNARITIICTVTAALMSLEETHNTLKFANRAKRIKNHAAINEVSNDKTLLKKYAEEIATLKEELARARASAEEAATLPPSIARLSPTTSSANKTLGSPKQHLQRALGNKTPSEATSSDAWAEDDDTEAQIQNAIAHIERLILRSKGVVKTETPGSKGAGGGVAAKGAGGSAGAGMARTAGGGSESGGSGGSGGSGASQHGAAESSDATGGDDDSRSKDDGSSGASIRRSRLPAPLVDRSSMIPRRQSTNFFDTKLQPLHSARDGASFSKAWEGTGAGKGLEGIGAHGEDWRRRSGASKAAHLRRQSEKWAWRESAMAPASEDVIVGTPPTVEGSAESSSGSPDRRPLPLETSRDALDVSSSAFIVNSSGEKAGEEDVCGTDGVDLQFELEHVHTELRNFLQKKRAKKLVAAGYPGPMEGLAYGGSYAQETVEELRQELQKKEIDTALSRADSNFLQRELEAKEADVAECMEVLEDMERQQKVLVDENASLRRENETIASEVTRLSAILSAREQLAGPGTIGAAMVSPDDHGKELHELKGVSAMEETF